MSAGEHLDAALAAERHAYETLLAGGDGREPLLLARDAYLASHLESSATSWGRLVGALKMAILAGEGVEPLAERAAAETAGIDSPTAAYARALAETALGRAPGVEPLLAAGGAFERTGRALAALAAGDGDAYARALGEVVADFECRQAHLSGVAIADTALVLERLADRRGMSVHPASPLLP